MVPVQTMRTQGEVVGPDVVLPGSQHLAPVFFGLLTAVALVVLVLALVIRRGRSRQLRRFNEAGGQGPVPRANRRPVVTVLSAVAVVALAALTITSLPPSFFTPEFPPTGRLFPDESVFYRSTEDLPAATDSERWIASMEESPLMAAFGGPASGGVVWGIPFNPVDDSTPRKSVRIRSYPNTSYLGEYPIADPAYIESMPTYGFDNHYVALDEPGRRMWELIGTTVWFGRWEAGSGALWNLDELTFPKGSTMASGLPLLPGVLTYDEVAAGRVDHVVHGIFPEISPDGPLWPARRSDGVATDPDAPPMGAWMRLRDDVELPDLGPQATVIAEGLRTYGTILTDTGGTFSLRGTPDGRWDPDDLATLRALTPSDFEVVDATSVMVDPNSMEARPPAG